MRARKIQQPRGPGTFMQDFAALPLDSLSPQQAVAQSQKLYNQLVADAASMPTLQQLIQV